MSFAYLPESVMSKWSQLSPSAKAVAGSVASFMDGQATGCWPSISTLKKHSGLKTERTVRKALQELSDAGILIKKKRSGQSNLFSWAKPLTSNAGGATDATPDIQCRGTPYIRCTEPPTSIAPLRIPKKDTKKDNSQKSSGTKSDHPNDGHIWKCWIGKNNDAGRRAPVRDGPDLNTAKRLADMVNAKDFTEDELMQCMEAYLSDPDKWLNDNGHALRFLPGKINTYLNSDYHAHSLEHKRSEDEFAAASLAYAESGFEESISAKDQDGKQNAKLSERNPV